MRKYLVLILLLVFTVLEGFGQQEPMFSQYLVNRFLINPAAAGLNGYTTINTVFREQYIGLDNAPRTFLIAAQTRLLENSWIKRKLPVRKDQENAKRDANIGLGVNIYNDRNGIVSKTGMELTYAYHINFENENQLSMGLSASGFQYKIDDSKAYLYNPDDPLLNENRKAFLVPDATVGIYFSNNRFFSGVSMSDLFGSTLKLGKSHLKDNFRTARDYNLMSGYRFNFEQGLSIEPSFLLRLTKFETLLDIHTRIYYKNDYWAGISYRTNNTIVALIGASVNMLYFGYAFDASLGTIKNYSSGSHEIMLGIKFGDNSTKRFKWLRKNQME